MYINTCIHLCTYIYVCVSILKNLFIYCTKNTLSGDFTIESKYIQSLRLKGTFFP